MKIIRTAGFMDKLKGLMPGQNPVLRPDQAQKLLLQRMQLIQNRNTGKVTPQQFQQQMQQIDARLRGSYDASMDSSEDQAMRAGKKIRDVQERALDHSPAHYEDEMSDDDADAMIARGKFAANEMAVPNQNQNAVSGVLQYAKQFFSSPEGKQKGTTAVGKLRSSIATIQPLLQKAFGLARQNYSANNSAHAQSILKEIETTMNLMTQASSNLEWLSSKFLGKMMGAVAKIPQGLMGLAQSQQTGGMNVESQLHDAIASVLTELQRTTAIFKSNMFNMVFQLLHGGEMGGAAARPTETCFNEAIAAMTRASRASLYGEQGLQREQQQQAMQKQKEHDDFNDIPLMG